MALVKWEPKRREVGPVRGLRTEIDRLFDDFFRDWGRPFGGGWLAPRWGELMPERGEFFPAVNLKETENEYVITAEVPGLKKGELDVNVGEDNVTLKGERKEEKEEKKENYHYKEAVYGAFERVIPLPGTIKSAEAKAQLKDGVLTLTLPKAEATKKKEIKVKVD